MKKRNPIASALLIIALLALSWKANAKTWYYNSATKTAYESVGSATKASAEESAKIVKIQATEQSFNSDTYRLKKSQDLDLAALKAVVCK